MRRKRLLWTDNVFLVVFDGENGVSGHVRYRADDDDDGMLRTTRMQRARHRVEHWPARKHVCECAGSERFSAIAPEPPTSPPTRTGPLATATFTTVHPHWSVALSPATVAERFPRNRRPPPSKPTRPYVNSILIVIRCLVFSRISMQCKKKNCQFIERNSILCQLILLK